MGDDEWATPSAEEKLLADRPRNGCAGGCLGLLATLGCLFCAVVGLTNWSGVYSDTGAVGPPGQNGWAGYVVVAALWGLGGGIVAANQSFERVGRTDVRVGRNEDPWTPILLGLLSMVAAILWPLQAPVVAVRLASWLRLRGRSAPLRRCVVGVGVLVLAAGSLWGVSAYQDHELKAPPPVSSAWLAGTWRVPGPDSALQLNADGKFVARHVPNELFTWDARGYVDAGGTWTFDGTYLTLSEAGSSESADADGAQVKLYAVDDVPVLCVSADPDSPCDYAFRRNGELH